MKVLKGYVLIKPLDADQTTESGLVLPDSSNQKPMEGIVEGTSSEYVIGDTIFQSRVKKGDKVIFKKWAGHEYKKSVFVKHEEILAVL